MIRTLVLAALLLVLNPAAQAKTADTNAVVLCGELAQPLRLDAQTLSRYPRREIGVSDHGTPARFAGVSLREVLLAAGAPMGKQLRGTALALYLEVAARDDYRAVFALAELDAGLGDREVLLVDTRDGKPMSAQEGPYRLIVPDDRRAARWVRQVQTLRLLRTSSSTPTGACS